MNSGKRKRKNLLKKRICFPRKKKGKKQGPFKNEDQGSRSRKALSTQKPKYLKDFVRKKEINNNNDNNSHQK